MILIVADVMDALSLAVQLLQSPFFSLGDNIDYYYYSSKNFDIHSYKHASIKYMYHLG